MVSNVIYLTILIFLHITPPGEKDGSRRMGMMQMMQKMMMERMGHEFTKYFSQEGF